MIWNHRMVDPSSGEPAKIKPGDVILHRLGVVLVLETIGDKGLLVLYKQSIRKISLDRRYIKTYDL